MILLNFLLWLWLYVRCGGVAMARDAWCHHTVHEVPTVVVAKILGPE